MTSPSREAFEAWADARDATHAGKLRIEDRGFDYPLGRVLDECWQAAIQHARDVAVMACEERLMNGSHEDTESASKLLQHSSTALTERHYRTRATKLKAVR